jgi:hypothetical protein
MSKLYNNKINSLIYVFTLFSMWSCNNELNLSLECGKYTLRGEILDSLGVAYSQKSGLIQSKKCNILVDCCSIKSDFILALDSLEDYNVSTSYIGDSKKYLMIPKDSSYPTLIFTTPNDFEAYKEVNSLFLECKSTDNKILRAIYNSIEIKIKDESPERI